MQLRLLKETWYDVKWYISRQGTIYTGSPRGQNSGGWLHSCKGGIIQPWNIPILAQHFHFLTKPRYPVRLHLILLLSKVTDSIYDLVGAETHPKVKVQNVEQVFTCMDSNRDGIITKEEFVNYCSNTNNVSRNLSVLPWGVFRVFLWQIPRFQIFINVCNLNVRKHCLFAEINRL